MFSGSARFPPIGRTDSLVSTIHHFTIHQPTHTGWHYSTPVGIRVSISINDTLNFSNAFPVVRFSRFASTLAENSSVLQSFRSQPQRYVVASIAGQRYVLAPKDILTVARIKDLRVGDKLLLSDVHEVGSRDYTIRGSPLLPPGTVHVDATVVEHTKGAMERIEKFKRRKHYKKTVTHKQTYTRIRIGDVKIKGIQEDTPTTS